MRMQFFHVPALAPEAAQTALDAFCAQHRVVTLEKHFVAQGDASYWAVCVTWVESAAALPVGRNPRRELRRTKIRLVHA